MWSNILTDHVYWFSHFIQERNSAEKVYLSSIEWKIEWEKDTFVAYNQTNKQIQKWIDKYIN